MTIKRYLYAGLGLLFLGLGAIGVIIPIIPTTPFLLLTSFFFLRSSERLNTWFEGTRMYKRFIANFMETRSLTLRAKILCAAPGGAAVVAEGHPHRTDRVRDLVLHRPHRNGFGGRGPRPRQGPRRRGEARPGRLGRFRRRGSRPGDRGVRAS